MADTLNYINAGTASVTAGTKTVTFVGVSLALMKAGDQFMQGGASGIIASVDIDAGTAQLVDNWGGADAAAQPYSVLVIPQASELAVSTRTIMQYLGGPILSIAAMMGDDQPDDGDILTWSDLLGGWDTVATSGTGDLLRAADPVITGHATIEGQHLAGVTGTGNLVLSAGPTLTGTLTAAAVNLSGALGITAADITVKYTGGTANAAMQQSSTGGFINVKNSAGTTIGTLDGRTGSSNQLSLGDGTGTKYAFINGGSSGSTGGAGLRIANGGSDVMGIGNKSAILGSSYDANGVINVASGKNLQATVNGSIGWTLGSDLSFLVGETTLGGWSGFAKTEVYQSGNGYGLSGYGSSSTSKALLLRIDSTSSALAHFFVGGSTNVGAITSNGTTTTYGTTSSFNLKMGAVSLDSQSVIAKANMMRGIWISNPDIEWVGGYAHEMAALVPDGYKASSTPYLAPHQDGYDPENFDYAKWVPYLIAEQQRQQMVETANDNRMAALEHRLAAAGIA